MLQSVLPGSISGEVFSDLNGNGVLDSGEPGLYGWTVLLDGTPATTNANGDYSFTGVMPGTHTISEVAPAGWKETVPTSTTYVVTVGSGQTITGENFGDQLTSNSTIAGRYIFYYDSPAWDPTPGGADDNLAIAPDKTPLLPGGTATFANYTSYALGINGILVDIQNLPGTPTAADFVFKVGNNDDPSLLGGGPTAAFNHRGTGPRRKRLRAGQDLMGGKCHPERVAPSDRLGDGPNRPRPERRVLLGQCRWRDGQFIGQRLRRTRSTPRE